MSIKMFSDFTNVIPILAKGDAFNVKEVTEVKRSIIEKAEELAIQFFDIRSVIDNIQDDRER